MLKHIGQTKVQSSRGRSTPRAIKAKPRPKFPVKKRNVKLVKRIRDTTISLV